MLSLPSLFINLCLFARECYVRLNMRNVYVWFCHYLFVFSLELGLAKYPTISRVYDALNKLPEFHDTRPTRQPDCPDEQRADDWFLFHFRRACFLIFDDRWYRMYVRLLLLNFITDYYLLQKYSNVWFWYHIMTEIFLFGFRWYKSNFVI
jgi:hypothetical protein